MENNSQQNSQSINAQNQQYQQQNPQQQQQYAPQQNPQYQQQYAPQQNPQYQQQYAPQQNPQYQQQYVPQQNPYNTPAPQPRKKKHTMRNIIFIVIAVLILAVLVSRCGKSSNDGQTSSVSTSATTATTASEVPAVTSAGENADVETTETAEEPEVIPTIESQVLYEGNEVRITATGLEKGFMGWKVGIAIENNSSLNLGFNAHAYAVNGLMSGNNIYAMDCDVAAGKKANTELDIYFSTLDELGISTIRCIDILFWAYDNDASYKEFDTDQIEIKTNLYDGTHDVITGSELYNADGIGVSYVTSNDNGNEFSFVVTNNTGSYVDLDFDDISFNDYTTSDVDYDLYDETLLNGCQFYGTIKADDEFKQMNGITDINKIDFNLAIRPYSDYFSEYKIGPISWSSATGITDTSAFSDITADNYCFDAVNWAVPAGIVSVPEDGMFHPDDNCSRGQVVTYLWHLAGMPEPASTVSSFSDVTDDGGELYKAIMWAVENGITSGTSDTTFSPDETVTRGQVVTFLWRYAGKPESYDTSASFDDVSADNAFYTPIMWAVNAGITSGTSDTTFGPDELCTKGQVITFLYRYAG